MDEGEKKEWFLSFLQVCVLVASVALPGCRTASPTACFSAGILQAPPAKSEAADLFAELGGEPAFFELARYLYRWYLDENDFAGLKSQGTPQLWLRRVRAEADTDDNSRYLEALLPSIGVGVRLKKADYRIAELNLAVKSGGYRIVRVSREAHPPVAQLGDDAVIGLDLGALGERLFKTRLEREEVVPSLRTYIECSVSRQADEIDATRRSQSKTLHVAPVQAIDNEVWVFWEEGKRLFRFSSDLDLARADPQTYELMAVDIYDTLAQTVVSFDERPGDNRFVTRDQVGRALYNCVVLGRKSAVP
jgi:hypothetical protein